MEQNRVAPILRHEFFKQYYGCFLVQRLVIVAALGRLHAGRAAVSAGTFLHSFQSSLPELGYNRESLLGDANASGLGVGAGTSPAPTPAGSEHRAAGSAAQGGIL